jgi:hypothetical protein
MNRLEDRSVGVGIMSDFTPAAIGGYGGLTIEMEYDYSRVYG